VIRAGVVAVVENNVGVELDVTLGVEVDRKLLEEPTGSVRELVVADFEGEVEVDEDVDEVDVVDSHSESLFSQIKLCCISHGPSSHWPLDE
jgi:hypothetical protein